MGKRSKMIETLIGQDAARELWTIGAIMDKSQSPDGKGFRLKLHDSNPNAPLSPFYADLRKLQSVTIAMHRVVAVYRRVVKREGFDPDLWAGIPQAGTPVTAWLSQATGIGMITPRMDKKGHGTGAKIDGIYEAGQSVVLIDDLVTSSKSKLEAIEVVLAAGLEVSGICVLLDRQQGGSQALQEAGYKFAAAFTITDLLNFYVAQLLMSKDMYEEIIEYLSL